MLLIQCRQMLADRDKQNPIMSFCLGAGYATPVLDAGQLDKPQVHTLQTMGLLVDECTLVAFPAFAFLPELAHDPRYTEVLVKH